MTSENATEVEIIESSEPQPSKVVDDRLIENWSPGRWPTDPRRRSSSTPATLRRCPARSSQKSAKSTSASPGPFRLRDHTLQMPPPARASALASGRRLATYSHTEFCRAGSTSYSAARRLRDPLDHVPLFQRRVRILAQHPVDNPSPAPAHSDAAATSASAATATRSPAAPSTATP